MGNFLLFGEAAWFDGLEFFNADGSFSRTDLLAGVEYSGFRDTTISFEILRRITSYNVCYTKLLRIRTRPMRDIISNVITTSEIK